MANQKKAVCTIGIAVANIIVFLLLSFGGRMEDGMYMLEHGAMYVPFVVEYKEYYRLFTCMFLHFGFSHLMNNMLTLVVIGWNVEMFVGKIRFLVIYFLSGLGGNLLSMTVDIWKQDYSVSAGASGAIFGLTGAMLCLAILNHGRAGNITKQGMIVMIFISLYTGFTSGGVDNFAHIGGLLTGCLVTTLLCWKRNSKS
jgi:rhomboid protease GluP